MEKTKQAVTYFRNKFNCSQSVLTVFGKELGLPEDKCLKIACAFGGGMGRQQLTCGAVTGALMALGLKYGKATGDPEEKKTETYAKTCELFERFRKLNGSITCIDLLNGLDMNDADDYSEILKQGLFVKLCEKYVTDAVEITEELLK